ncbi:MAG: 50S ribosomal protein L10 [Elusimicrobia bacterium]|nr:50S ribosomal protein L10 [Elusimicrobiota bacterium]
MKLTRKEKVEKSKDIADKLKNSPHLFFTEYQGLKFKELDELRAKLRPLRCRYAVIKNSLIRHALKGAGIPAADVKLLKGPVGMVVSDLDDPVAPAKVLAAFAKQYPFLKVKAGLVSQKWMSPAECQTLSRLPSRPELIAKAVGMMYSVICQPVSLMQAPARDVLLVVKALEQKKKSQSGAAAA